MTSLFSCSYIIQKQRDPSKAHQVKLEVIVKALKWLEMDMDVDEVLFLIYFYFYFLSLTHVWPRRSFRERGGKTWIANTRFGSGLICLINRLDTTVIIVAVVTLFLEVANVLGWEGGLVG